MIQRSSPIHHKFRPLRRYLHTHATRIFTFEQGAERLPLFSAWLVSITPSGAKRQPAKTSNFGHRAPQQFVAEERGATDGASDPFLLDHQEFAGVKPDATIIDEQVNANVTLCGSGTKNFSSELNAEAEQVVKLLTGRLERPPEFIHVRPKLNLSKAVDDLPYTLDDSLLALEQKLVGPLLSAARARHETVEAELRLKLERIEAERDAMKSERNAALIKLTKLQTALTLHRTYALEQKKSRR